MQTTGSFSRASWWLVLAATAMLAGCMDGSSARAGASSASDATPSTAGAPHQTVAPDPQPAPGSAPDSQSQPAQNPQPAQSPASHAQTVPSPEAATSSAILSWQIPTENTNGSPLTDLAGFRIYYGTNAEQLNAMVVLANPGTEIYEIGGLVTGETYYFAIASVTSAGTESARSAIVSKTIS